MCIEYNSAHLSQPLLTLPFTLKVHIQWASNYNSKLFEEFQLRIVFRIQLNLLVSIFFYIDSWKCVSIVLL